jgi:hypothetical protein
MTLPKLLALTAIILFGAIGIAAIFKKPTPQISTNVSSHLPIEVDLDQEIQIISPALMVQQSHTNHSPSIVELPEADRIEELFVKDSKLPIVETITYKSRVNWQKGRPAWLSDYAAHFETSRHFIARSLNGKADYLKQDLLEGDRFNILRKEKDIRFHLIT